MDMHADKARGAIETLAKSLGVDSTRAAAGVLEIINVNMMGAVRVISVEQGVDPRDFTLVAFGGAGPLHAADIARQMGIRKVLVPPRPGLLSAIGLLHAEVRGDFSLTRLVRADADGLKSLKAGFSTLEKRGAQWLKGERESNGTFQWFADLRYLGQNFELILELGSDPIETRTLPKLVEAFHARHKNFYGYDMRNQPVEIVNLRLVVTGEPRKVPNERTRLPTRELATALTEKRQVWFPETGFVPSPVYDRARVPGSARIVGPAIIEQMDTTTVVPPKAELTLDKSGYLHMDLEPVQNKKGAAWAAA
jgi:N-methylhydantoinase A